MIAYICFKIIKPAHAINTSLNSLPCGAVACANKTGRSEITPWVLISVYKDYTDHADLEGIAPQIRELIDMWQSQGGMM